MRTRAIPGAVWGALALVAFAGCSSVDARTEEQAYEVTDQVASLVLRARAGEVTVEPAEGPIQVTETYRYSNDRPQTSHQVSGTSLRLTVDGCANDEWRCHVSYLVRVPATTSVEITTQAGAVRLTDLAGNIAVATEAGTVEGTGLAGKEVSVTTQAGATTLEFAEPPTLAKASTELGAIVVKVPGGTAYAVEVASKVGGSEVHVQQDSTSPHKISVRTEVGGVRVENA